jgi:hypothetical protein
MVRAILFSFLLVLISSITFAQRISAPERNPCKLSVRGGAMSNNHDQAAELKSKFENGLSYTVNTDYAAIGEIELGLDLIRMRGAVLGFQVSTLYSRPEFKSTAPDGSMQRVGLTQLGILRANITISFNGTDPYTMFEVPYHSNKEAVLGVSGMIIRTEDTKLTRYAIDSLGITNISGDYSQALGLTFGWNWRIGESGWVAGINGALMFVINKSHLVNVETDDKLYSSGYVDFAPRILTAGIGYHF